MRERRGHPLTVRLFSKVIELDGARTGEGCHLFRRWGRIGDASRGKHILAKMHRLDAIEGFEAVFLGRADYGDLSKRVAGRQLEFPWAPSASRPGSAATAMILGSGNYGDRT